jgi:predicted dehydrogenase
MTTVSSNAELPLNTGKPEIGIGMLGYAFMGKAHTNAYKKIPYILNTPPAVPRLVAIAGRDEKRVRAAAIRYGYTRYTTDWHTLMDDPQIQLFDNGAPPKAHMDACIAAANAGKAVFCEKPLARNREEASAMLDAVQKNKVKHMVGFNYRFVPAVMHMRHLLEEGLLGRIYHFRTAYLQDWLLPAYAPEYTWRTDRESAGTGVIGSLGSHIIDLARFLVGEIEEVSAQIRTFNQTLPNKLGQPQRVEVDETFVALVSFANGVLGTLEASRVAAGYKNYNMVEISGEFGALRFNLERLNELEYIDLREGDARLRGNTTVLMTHPSHPFIQHWWPEGHLLGWEHTFVHEFAHFLDCIINDKKVAPYGATFEDGFRAALICDAILTSARSRKVVSCQ